MKGDIYFNKKGQLQCRYCHEHPKRGMNTGCGFCKRMRWIAALKPGKVNLVPDKPAR